MSLTPEQLAELEPHPFANIYPMLPERELLALGHDIAGPNGLLDPIMLFQGMILDGRNRHAAMKLCGVAFDAAEHFTEFGGDEDEATAYVEAKNEKRRHLSTGQRRMAGARRLEMLGLKAGDANTKTTRDGKTVRLAKPAHPKAAKVCEQFAIGPRQLQEAAYLREKIRKPIAKMVEDGRITFNAAERIAEHHTLESQKQFRTPEAIDAEVSRIRHERPFKGYTSNRLAGTCVEVLAELASRGGIEAACEDVNSEHLHGLTVAHVQLGQVIAALAARQPGTSAGTTAPAIDVPEQVSASG